MKLNVVVCKIPVLAIGIATLFSVSGCGTAAKFEKQDVTSTNVASQYTKPKIDILFIQDTSSSMAGPIAQIKPQLDSFLNGIDASWDYHFTVVPLHKTLPLTSKYIVAQDCSTITSPYCLNSSQKSLFNQGPAGTEYTWINTTDPAAGNVDAGFTNITNNLNHADMLTTNFLRADAALAIVVLSNGEDVSGMTYPTDYMSYQGTGTMIPNPNSPNAVNSFNSFKNFMNTVVKPMPGLTKFYSVVADNNYSNCYGGATWQGLRYMNMSNATTGIGGAYYNLCNGGLTSVLSNLNSQLNSFIQAFIFNYAVIPNQPIVNSIVVKKNGVVVPQSNTNGWQYIGLMSNTNTAYLPYPSNKRSGYFIKMNGSAEYSGADVITVDYQRP